MRPASNLCRAPNNLANTGTLQITPKNLVRIVQKADHQVEAGEVMPQLGIELTVPGKKPGKRSMLNGANRVGIKSVLNDSRDMFVAEDLQTGGWKCIPQRFQRGQGQNEIADGAAAHHQDAVDSPPGNTHSNLQRC